MHDVYDIRAAAEEVEHLVDQIEELVVQIDERLRKTHKYSNLPYDRADMYWLGRLKDIFLEQNGYCAVYPASTLEELEELADELYQLHSIKERRDEEGADLDAL